MPACCCIPVGRHAASPYRRIAVSMHCRPAPQQDRSACVYQTVALRCLPGLGGALSAPCARLCNRLYRSTARSQFLLWVDNLPLSTVWPPGSRTRGPSGSTCALRDTFFRHPMSVYPGPPEILSHRAQAHRSRRRSWRRAEPPATKTPARAHGPKRLPPTSARAGPRGGSMNMRRRLWLFVGCTAPGAPLSSPACDSRTLEVIPIRNRAKSP